MLGKQLLSEFGNPLIGFNGVIRGYTDFIEKG